MPHWKRIELSKEDERLVRSAFKKKSKFLIDENLGIGTVEYLCKRGWNTVGVCDLGIQGHDDTSVFATAYRSDRILLTHDHDFLNNKIFPLQSSPGIVIFPYFEGKEKPLMTALINVVSIIGNYREIYRKSKILWHEDETMTINSINSNGQYWRQKYKFPKHGLPFVLECDNKEKC